MCVPIFTGISILLFLHSFLHSCYCKQQQSFSINTRYSVSLEAHEERVKQLQLAVKGSGGKKFVLKRQEAESHCVRRHDYKNDQTVQLDVSGLTKIISVHRLDEDLKGSIPRPLRPYCKEDEIVAYVDVEAMTSFEDLVDGLLPLNLMPCVVPEFKGITVGGSLQGLAAESTSFRYGFVHDCIVGIEVLLCDGTLIWCSETLNQDLFHALPGSFGTIGICTKVRMLCCKAEDFVLLKCNNFQTQRQAVNKMSQLQNLCIQNSQSPGANKFKSKKEWRKIDGGFELVKVSPAHPTPEEESQFLEAIGFKDDEFVSIVGRFATKEEADKYLGKVNLCNTTNNSSTPVEEIIRVDKISTCGRFGDLWFFNQVRNAVRSNKSYLLIPIKDYLFRHDRGSFWMASYRIPQIFGRFMGSLLDSTSMFRLANLLPWLFPKSSICLQDFMLPREMVVDFHDRIQEMLDLYPIWLLPMRKIPTSKKSLFAAPDSIQSHLCNIGIHITHFTHLHISLQISPRLITSNLTTKNAHRSVWHTS